VHRLWEGEHIQNKLGSNAAVGAAKRYFDETFQCKTQDTDICAVFSMNLTQDTLNLGFPGPSRRAAIL
jgi:hypothetical protein